MQRTKKLVLGKLHELTEKQFLLVLITSDLVLKIFRLWDPAQPYFDEKPYYLKAARDYLHGVFTTNPEHPPLAKLIIAAGMKVFGDNPFGWRLPGVFLGSLGVVTTYFLAKKLTGSKRIASIAAIFLSLEFGWFISSRVATIEIYLASFLLLGSFFVVKLFQENKLINLIPAGLFLGAALASKWSALLLIGWLFVFLIIFWKKRFFVKILTLFVLGSLIAMVYLASYLPFLLQHSLVELWQLHKWIYSYHTGVVVEVQKKIVLERGYEFYSAPAWAWFLDPPFAFFGQALVGQTTKTILFFFNPVVLWGGGISALILLKDQFRKLEPKVVFFLGAFLCQYLPWFASPRYLLPYYLLSAMPFLAICFAIVLNRLWKTKSVWVYALVSLTVAAFILYYPMISALKIPYLYSRIVSGVVGFDGVRN